jgi:hypothetical protein
VQSMGDLFIYFGKRSERGVRTVTGPYCMDTVAYGSTVHLGGYCLGESVLFQAGTVRQGGTVYRINGVM